MQTRHWVFTINNWTVDDESQLETLGPNVTYLVYGYERGAAGTHHIQGYVIFPKVKRLSEAKKLIGARSHLEPKRGTPDQAATYCKKDGIFKEYGELPRCPGSRGQFDEFIQWVMSREDGKGSIPSEREIAQAFPSLFVRYRRALFDLAKHHCPHPVLEKDQPLWQWQSELQEALLKEPVDDRTILFYVDQEGGKGKSYFQRHMLSQFPEAVQVLSCGKRDDVAHAIDVTKRIFLFNIPRKAMEYVNYNIFEMLKDKMIFSPKYDSTTKILHRNPHVVVFSNEMPKMEDMTFDRYKIIDDF